MGTSALLLEHAAKTLESDDFGMRPADRELSPHLLKLLDRLVNNAPTPGKAALNAITHMGAYSLALRETLEFDSATNLFKLRNDLRVQGMPPAPQLAEQALLLIHRATLNLTRGAVRSRKIWFAHPQVGSLEAYRTRFGTLVRFSQECDAILYTGEDLRHEIAGHDNNAYETEKAVIRKQFPCARVSRPRHAIV